MRKAILSLILTIIVTGISCHNFIGPGSNSYHNKILFTSGRSGIPQLYMMNPDGSDIRPLTSGPYSHSQGRWSPDAQQILATTNENTSPACPSEMVLLNPDGTSHRLLGCGSEMAWSPDGRKIIFEFCPSCELGQIESALYITYLENDSTVKLPVDGGYPDWAPNDDTILINSSYSISGNLQTQFVLLDYPQLSNTQSVGPVGGVYGAWSPDGGEIAYGYPDTVIDGVHISDIYVMRGDGSASRRVTHHVTLEYYDVPRWSPDGSKLIFLAYSATSSPQNVCLYMVNEDGTKLHEVMADSTVTSADWSK